MNARKLALHLLLTGALSTLPACSSSVLLPRLRLLTLNLVRAEDGSVNLEETARAIRGTVPDLVSVGGATRREIEELGRLTGFDSIASQTEDDDRLGIGILTRWPLVRTDRDRRAVAVDVDFKPLSLRELRGSDPASVPVVLASEYTSEEKPTGSSRLMRPDPQEPSIRAIHHQKKPTEAGDVHYALPFQWEEFDARRVLEKPIRADLRVFEFRALVNPPKEP